MFLYTVMSNKILELYFSLLNLRPCRTTIALSRQGGKLRTPVEVLDLTSLFTYLKHVKWGGVLPETCRHPAREVNGHKEPVVVGLTT